MIVTYVPTTGIVAVVVVAFVFGKFWFFAPYEFIAGIGPVSSLEKSCIARKETAKFNGAINFGNRGTFCVI